MNKKNETIIKCPVCGCQYMISEIYYPKSFLGTPSDIIKDEKGEILGFDGEDANMIETYTCDKCNSKFKVKATINFTTTVID